MTTLQSVFFWLGIACVGCFGGFLLIVFSGEVVDYARRHKWL